MGAESSGGRFDRRSVLRKAAAAGVVGWTAPMIISSGVATAGVFTAKCAPGAISATAGFTQTACTGNNTTVRITINFSGPCPCGGIQEWCAQKNSPNPAVSAASATLVFPVTVPIGTTITISGKVALGCTDRDGDTQFAVYNWAMTARDNGNACGSANSISGVTLSGRTVSISESCPALNAAVLAAPQSIPAESGLPPGYIRPG